MSFCTLTKPHHGKPMPFSAPHLSSYGSLLTATLPESASVVCTSAYRRGPSVSVFGVRDYRSLASPFTPNSLLMTAVKSLFATASTPLNKGLQGYQEHVERCWKLFEAGTISAEAREEMLASYEMNLEDLKFPKVAKDSVANSLKLLMQQCLLRFTERAILVGLGGYTSSSSSVVAVAFPPAHKYSFLSKLVKDPCKSVTRKVARGMGSFEICRHMVKTLATSQFLGVTCGWLGEGIWLVGQEYVAYQRRRSAEKGAVPVEPVPYGTNKKKDEVALIFLSVFSRMLKMLRSRMTAYVASSLCGAFLAGVTRTSMGCHLGTALGDLLGTLHAEGGL